MVLTTKGGILLPLYCATTVGGNRLYNFAHRSSQLLHNGPGSMMRKIPSSMDRVAFCVPLAVFASSNNASYFCVILPKKDIFPYIRVLLLFLCALILTIMYIFMYIYAMCVCVYVCVCTPCI